MSTAMLAAFNPLDDDGLEFLAVHAHGATC
jgi:hypothetical protein